MDFLSVEVESLLDLGRFAAALERLPRTILSIRKGEGYKMAIFVEELDDTLIFLEGRSERSSQFLMYEATSVEDRIEFVEKVREYAASYIPVIQLAEEPEFLKGKKGFVPPLRPVKVESLTDLVKLALYKLHYDESPVPLYLSEEEDGHHLGAIVKVVEGEGPSYYFHAEVEGTEGGFLKVNTADVRDVKFSKGVGEHGYLYIKVIKLKGKLGLV